MGSRRGGGAGVAKAIEPKHSVAHTTVATITLPDGSDRACDSEGRANIYRPKIRREDVGQSMVSDLADRMFQGDRAQLVAHLLAGEDITTDELARLKKLVRDKEKELRDEQ